MSNDTEVLTLTAFLLARIADDEEGARLDLADDQRRGFADSGYAEWGWSPARVLAECEAKRRIVGHFSRHRPEFWGGIASVPLGALASVYADHPDYDESWRP